jgi:hypothetical protein
VAREATFEANLELAARALCNARRIDPNSGERAAWRNAADELRDAWLISQFAKML